MRHHFRAAGKLVEFEHAHRAVPHNRAGVFQQAGQLLRRLRADVQNHIVRRHIVHRFVLCGCVFGKFFGAHHVGRQRHDTAFGRHFRHDFFRFVHQIRFGKRFADGLALRQQEGVGNAAADNQQIHFVGQAFQDGELGGDFAAGHNRGHRAGGFFQGFAQSVQFGGHQDAGARQRCGGGHGFGGSFRAVCSAECVVHEHVAQGGIGFAQFGAVFLFAFVNAYVLQQVNFTGGHFGRIGLPVVQHADVFTQQRAQAFGHGRDIVFRLELAFGGAAQMAHHDDACAVV